MADFYQFIDKLLQFEGGYADDPHDPGGETNKGITIATFRACAQEVLGIPGTSLNLRHLADEQAKRIYKARFWDVLRCDEIAFQPLADMLFDFYVNAGTRAVGVLFAVVKGVGMNAPEAFAFAANPMGSVEYNALMARLRTMDQAEVYRLYKASRAAYYEHLAHVHPNLRRYLGGWLKRVNSFPEAK